MNREENTILNVEECLEIVRKAQKTPHIEADNLLSYAVKCSNGLVGFMGEYFELHVRLQDKTAASGERELCYFVKSVPITNKYHKDECERKGFFDKETRIYTEILPHIRKYATTPLSPECYYTRPDLIVLEDLAAQGFHHLSAADQYTMSHYKLVLSHLAKLHAASMAWETVEGVNIGERFGDVLSEKQLTTRNEWYVTGIRAVLFLAKKHPNYQSPTAQRFVNEQLYSVLSHVEELTKPSQKYRNVLCHRDTWERNIFFQTNKNGEPTDCRIVDFQLTRYSPPAIDVLFFLYNSMPPEQRKRSYNKCLDYYHTALATVLGDMQLSQCLVSKAEFLEDCQRTRLASLVTWAICEPMLKMPMDIRNKLRAEEPQMFDHYMNSEREELFARIMEIDPDYKDMIMTPVEELLDYLLENIDLYK